MHPKLIDVPSDARIVGRGTNAYLHYVLPWSPTFFPSHCTQAYYYSCSCARQHNRQRTRTRVEMLVCSAMGRKWGTTVGHSGGKHLSHVPRFWHHWTCLYLNLRLFPSKSTFPSPILPSSAPSIYVYGRHV